MTGSIDTSASRRALLAGALGMGGTAMALGGPTAAMAAGIPTDPNSNFHLGLSGISGESTDSGLGGTLNLLTWSFGVTSSANPLAGGGGGGGGGKSAPGDFVFVHRLSKASPKLFEFCASGKSIASATLTVRTQGETPFNYLTVVLSNSVITSYQVAPGEQDGYPIDVVHLKYTKIVLTHRIQDDSGGIGTVTTGGWDFKKNVKA